MHTPLMRTRLASRRRLLAPALVAVLTLAGCSGGDSSSDGSAPDSLRRRRARATPSSSDSASATTTPYLPVPGRGRAHRPGQRRSTVGERAVVAWRAAPEAGRRARHDGRPGWRRPRSRSPSRAGSSTTATRTLDAVLRARDGHERRQDRPRRAGRCPLYLARRAQHAARGVDVREQLQAVPEPAVPGRSSSRGDKAKVCLVYLAPEHGDLTAVSFRPTQDFDADHLDRRGRPSREADRSRSTRSRQERRLTGRPAATRRVWPRRRAPGPTDDARRHAPALTLGSLRVDDAGGAGADGGHHQRGLPPAVRRAGRRALRLRDDHLPRPGRGRRARR